MPFTGLAQYTNGVMAETAEDVSGTVTMISRYETPFLDLVGDSMDAATSTLHEFLEDELGPNLITSSTNVASNATGTDTITITGGQAAYLQVGMILEAPDASINVADTVPEQFQITAISGNDITISRAFAATSASSFASGQEIVVISDAALEGADVVIDTSKTRSRLNNIVQTFKKDIIISDIAEATRKLGGIVSEKDYQLGKKLKEALRDLEKAAIRGRISGSTTASSSVVRTMRGLIQWISTNNISAPSSAGSPIGDFEAELGNMVEKAWKFGGTDCDAIICGSQVKKRIDQLNSSRARSVPDDRVFTNRVDIYDGTYGTYRIQLNPWMPGNRAVMIASGRIAMAPLTASSFHYEDVARTGMAQKGFVAGTYTMELRNEKGMAQTRWSQLAQLNTP